MCTSFLDLSVYCSSRALLVWLIILFIWRTVGGYHSLFWYGLFGVVCIWWCNWDKVGLLRTNNGGFSYVFSDTFYSKEEFFNDIVFSVTFFQIMV